MVATFSIVLDDTALFTVARRSNSSVSFRSFAHQVQNFMRGVKSNVLQKKQSLKTDIRAANAGLLIEIEVKKYLGQIGV